eukprot:7016243-Pyramimonas_sp.AAC.1
MELVARMACLSKMSRPPLAPLPTIGVQFSGDPLWTNRCGTRSTPTFRKLPSAFRCSGNSRTAFGLMCSNRDSIACLAPTGFHAAPGSTAASFGSSM